MSQQQQRRWHSGSHASPQSAAPQQAFYGGQGPSHYGQQQDPYGGQQQVPWGTPQWPTQDLSWMADAWAQPTGYYPAGPPFQSYQDCRPQGPIGQASVYQAAEQWAGSGAPSRSAPAKGRWNGSGGRASPASTAIDSTASGTDGKPLCKFLSKPAGCNLGDRCKYYHPPSEGQAATQGKGSANVAWGGAVGSGSSLGCSERQTAEGGAAASSGGGRGKGVGKGKRKGGWGGGLPRHVQVSKTLTQILRHKAPDLGIKITSSGFCKTEDILAAAWLRELDATLEDVEKVVKESDKQRFEVQVIDGIHHIRAVQGHSIEAVEDDSLLRRLMEDDPDLPERCVHGTYRRHLAAIMASGLKPGGSEGACFRKHVHFSPFAPGDKKVISGMRYDAEVAIWVDIRKAMAAGIPFYISPNKVILSPGNDELIPSQFFEKVTEVKTGKVVEGIADATAIA